MTGGLALLQGIAVGLAIAAPVGPIGLLCIRRTLAGGVAAGLASGLGAATADGLYGLVAAFGVSELTAAAAGATGPLRLAGGLLLLWLGTSALRKPAGPPVAGTAAPEPGVGRLAGAWLSTLALTLANPLTILSFAAILGSLTGAGAGGGADGARLAGVLMVAGIFLGSALWWLGLSLAVAQAGRHLPPVALTWIDRVSGAVLCGFGAWTIADPALLELATNQ